MANWYVTSDGRMLDLSNSQAVQTYAAQQYDTMSRNGGLYGTSKVQAEVFNRARFNGAGLANDQEFSWLGWSPFEQPAPAVTPTPAATPVAATPTVDTTQYPQYDDQQMLNAFSYMMQQARQNPYNMGSFSQSLGDQYYNSYYNPISVPSAGQYQTPSGYFNPYSMQMNQARFSSSIPAATTQTAPATTQQPQQSSGAYNPAVGGFATNYRRGRGFGARYNPYQAYSMYAGNTGGSNFFSTYGNTPSTVV